MKLAILKERRAGEARVAATPDAVKRLKGLGLDVVVEDGAGAGTSIPDQHFIDAGASIAADAAAAAGDADIVLKVQRPLTAADGMDEAALLKPGALLIALLAPYQNRDQVAAYAQRGISAFAMEMVPRISRAQSMDVLSSQANLAGYKAVLDAAVEFGKAFPMMMTAAGTVAPARVMIFGVGVAGLQAIATARRLGAVVSATDVRPATKEQVQSLGAKFVAVEDEEFKAAETAGGYAKQMSAEYQAKQAALVAEHIRQQDIVITTALIPGRKAPVLVSEDMVKTMKPGSVIVDMAASALGGNCELTKAGQTLVTDNGVTIIGPENLPASMPASSSAFYARNISALLLGMVKDGNLNLDFSDEVTVATVITKDGAVVQEATKKLLEGGAA